MCFLYKNTRLFQYLLCFLSCYFRLRSCGGFRRHRLNRWLGTFPRLEPPNLFHEFHNCWIVHVENQRSINRCRFCITLVRFELNLSSSRDAHNLRNEELATDIDQHFVTGLKVVSLHSFPVCHNLLTNTLLLLGTHIVKFSFRRRRNKHFLGDLLPRLPLLPLLPLGDRRRCRRQVTLGSHNLGLLGSYGLIQCLHLCLVAFLLCLLALFVQQVSLRRQDFDL